MKVRKIDEWTQQERRAFTKWISELSSGIDYMKPGLYAIIDKAIEIATREKKYRIIKDPVKLAKSIKEGYNQEFTTSYDVLIIFENIGKKVIISPDDNRCCYVEGIQDAIKICCIEEYTDD